MQAMAVSVMMREVAAVLLETADRKNGDVGGAVTHLRRRGGGEEFHG